MNSYELSRLWFDWCFENPEKINPNHSALYFFCIEHCNRLGWKEKFGLPTTMAKEAIGIKSYGTYIKTLNDLVDWGFIIMLEKSKNQYSANIVALSKNDKALDKALNKALDKALVKHASKQVQSTHQSISSINKQITNNNITNNNSVISALPQKFSFYNSLIDYGFKKELVYDWIAVRKNKKATNTQTAFNSFIREIEKRTCDLNEILEFIVSKNWSGFKWEWYDKENNFKSNENGKSTITQTEQFKQIAQAVRSDGIRR